MTASLLHDAMAHHIWATERLIDACGALTAEQLRIPAPGTYGPILDTLRHLVSTDGWYLTFFRDWTNLVDEDAEVTLAELRSAVTTNGTAWMELLAGDLDGEADVVEHGDGWTFHSPLGFRLAQAAHHGTDHRSQTCTALTSLGVEPPAIDLWAYGEATGRTRAEYLTAT
jgi:uncharacterized damage-inducible protein DinB